MNFIVPFNRNNNELADKDDQLIHLENLIESKRQMLLEKQKKLRFVYKQNQFLGVVREDYDKYYSYIVKQKQDQMKALQLLNTYVDDLTRSGNLTKHNVADAKHEQRKIVSEMKSIQMNLDEIVSNTHDIHKTLQNKHIV
jgi:flagellar biosynthesis chaperone FliJ